MSTPWDRFVIPHLDSLVEVMAPCYFLDKLLARNQMSRAEYIELRPKTAPEQVRKLVTELLPTRPNSYEDFRQVLRDTKEQSHLLDQYFPPDDQPLPVHPSPLPSSQNSTPVSLISADKECTTDDIRLIYMNISPYWHKIGVELKLPKYELDKIKSEESKDDERCYKMLHTWLNKNFGKATATVFSLFDAIRDVHCPLDAITHSKFDSSLIDGWKTHSQCQ